MTKLLVYDLKDAQKLLLPIFGISMALALISVGLSQVHHALFQNISSFCAILSLLTGMANLAVFAVWSGKTWKDTFFAGPATLYRTLPLSRTELMEACLLSALIAFIETSIFCVCPLFVLDWQEIPTFFHYFPELVSSFGWFILTFFFEGICCLLVIDLGLIIGYRFRSSKLGWSILFMGVLWIITGIITCLALAPVLGANFEALNTDLMPIEPVRQLMKVGSLSYLLLDLIYLGLIYWQLKKGVDIDS